MGGSDTPWSPGLNPPGVSSSSKGLLQGEWGQDALPGSQSTGTGVGVDAPLMGRLGRTGSYSGTQLYLFSERACRGRLGRGRGVRNGFSCFTLS